MKTIIYVITVALNVHFRNSLDPGGYKVCINDNGQPFCCFNHEEQNGTCVACAAGTLSKNGGSCTECRDNLYGNRCAFECKCTQHQRCDKEVGCVNNDFGTSITDASDIDGSTVKIRSSNSGQDDGISRREWIIYSSSSALIIIIIVIGICFLKCRQNAGEKRPSNNQFAVNVTSDNEQREQNEGYDEIDETLLVDNVQGRSNGRNEGGTHSSRPQPNNADDTSSYLQPYHEEEPSESDTVIVDRFGYLIIHPSQPSENNRQDKSNGCEEKGSGMANNQKADETFTKEVYTQHSYQKLQQFWQRSVHKYDTPNLNTGLVFKQPSCTNVSNDTQLMKTSDYDGYTDAKSRASK